MKHRGSFPWPVMMSVCALTAGCNVLLGNEEHGLVADDASVSLSSFDAGSPGAVGSNPTDGGVQGYDVQGADAPAVALDAPPDEPPEPGAEAGTEDGSLPPIAFVQVASRDSKDSAATISAAYASAQQAGDLAVVVVGWTDPTHKVSSISDSAGNSYQLAMPPTSASGVVIAIYYATGIAAATANSVTVDFDASDFPCLAILEYSGVSHVDETAVGTGSGTTASTATVVTSAARELIFGAGEPDQNGTANFAPAGAGFTARVITGTSGMLAEDTIGLQGGTYTATGGLTASSPWVMQAVTFK